jgi:enoyl-CoA hydratase/carnithine racemase
LEQLRVADAIASLPMPVVVSINGDALDHGLEIALAGDLRITVAEARFGLTDLAKKGSFPWDGGTQRLPRLVGPAWARDMILTSRVIDAAQALDLGLVNRLVVAAELEQETRHTAEAISRGGPIAVRYAKEAINKGMDLSLAQGLRLEADLNIILQSTADRAEGLRSFTEKRTPRFSGR